MKSTGQSEIYPWSLRRLIMDVAVALILLTISMACGRRDANDAPSGTPDSEPGVIETLTGKAAVDRGQRAKEVIREVDRERQRQLDEVLND